MIYLEYVKKYMWAIRLVMVAFTAYLAANAVSIYIRGALYSAPTLTLASQAAGDSAYVPLDDYAIVVKRSLFFSPGMNMGAGFNKMDQGPLLGSDDFQLLGTVAGDPEDSFAVINTRHDGKTDVYRVGEKIAGAAEVLAIRAREVELMHDGTRKVIKLPDWGTPALAGMDRWQRSVGEAVADGIKKVGDGEFVISQDVVDEAFSDMASMLRGARIMPQIENGAIVGFKVFRIKKDSLYAKIGLQNGDVLHRVNSVEIKGPEDGLRLFQELRTAKSISIDISRGGQRQTLSYTVR